MLERASGDRGIPEGRPSIILICDKAYFVPTFATALSAEWHTAGEDIAILIFVVDAEEGWPRQFDHALAGSRIAVRPASLPQLADAAAYHRDRYLPPITLARLWIDDLLDPDIDRFLYLDGDIMVGGDLKGLLSMRPPETGLMAAPDFLRIFWSETGLRKRHDAAYLEQIGCRAESYFNAGVIYASRTAWNRLAPEALAFLVEHPELCRSSDQSALNHAARGKVTLLPLRYNYSSDHMMACDPRRRGITPAIWHFTGGPKPWDAADWPWDESFNRFYRLAEHRLQGTGVDAPVSPPAQMEAGLVHRRRTRRRLDWVYPWRKISRSRKILRLMLAHPGDGDPD